MPAASPLAPSRARTALTLPLLLIALLATLVVDARPATAAESTALRLSPLSQTINAGSYAYVSLTLRTASNAPVVNAPVTVMHYVSGAWRGLKEVRTNADGWAKFAVKPGATTRYGAVFKGDTTRARSQSPEAAVVNVRASLGQRIIQEASRHRGKPYQWGATGPSRFDCSGFTLYVFQQFGKSLPHNSGQQEAVTRDIPMSQIQPGDLVFTHTNGRISHVGIYAGGGKMWHSPRSGSSVHLADLVGRTVTAGRVA